MDAQRVLQHNSYGTCIKPAFFAKLEPNSELYATQAVLKGGVGEFVAQGLSKRGQNENPNSRFFSPSCTQEHLQATLTNSLLSRGLKELQATQSRASRVRPGVLRELPTQASLDAEQARKVFSQPAFAFEYDRKNDGFRTAFRSTKRWDIDHASKWACLSHYENSAHVVEQHLTSLAKLETDRIAALLKDREARAERTRRVQNRTRHAFGALQLKNDIAHVNAGLQPPARTAAAAVYSTELGSDGAALHPQPSARERPRTAGSNPPFRVADRMAWEQEQHHNGLTCAAKKRRAQSARSALRLTPEEAAKETLSLDYFQQRLEWAANQGGSMRK